MPMNPRLLRPRASATGFDPRKIGTLAAWYDFSDSSTLALVNSLVSEIRNKSGTAPTLSQGVEANRPSLSAINGKQAALFDGANDHLFSNTAVAGEGTIFAVFGRTGNNNSVAVSFCAAPSTITALAVGTAAGNDATADASVFGRFSGTGGVFTGTAQTLDSPHVVVSGTFNRTAAPALRVNGVTGTQSVSAFTGNANQAAIGARNVSTTYQSFFNSTVGEVLLYPSVLSAAQIQAVERYLAAKWGISL